MFNKQGSKEAPLSSSNYRKYQHRRIHTEIDQPSTKIVQKQYYKPINKQYSKPKFLDNHTNRLPAKESGTKSYKFNKPNLLFSRNLKTDLGEDYSDSNRSNKPKGSKYQIDGVAGRGTFGVVYYGKVRLTGEKVALKKVLQDKKYKNR